MRWTAIDRILDQDLPSVACLLQRIQIERNKIVEKVAFDLASEDIKLTTQDVQCVAITTGRARTRRKCARPLLGCCS